MRMREIMQLVEATNSPFPVGQFNVLYHVGSMKQTDKGSNSYEGGGLSVSQHPEEWKQIARGTVQGQTWTLTKSGNSFVLARRLSAAHKKIVAAWAVKNGWAEAATAYRVTYYDEEDEAKRWFVVKSREEAETEAEEYEDAKISEVSGSLHGTPRMLARCRTREALDPFDLLLTLYVEDELQLDGVWWADRLDPTRLSAPRGVIVPSQVSSWKAAVSDISY